MGGTGEGFFVDLGGGAVGGEPGVEGGGGGEEANGDVHAGGWRVGCCRGHGGGG